jgi:hypothetical protein
LVSQTIQNAAMREKIAKNEAIGVTRASRCGLLLRSVQHIVDRVSRLISI